MRKEPPHVKEYAKFFSYLDGMPNSHRRVMKQILHNHTTSASTGMVVALTKGIKSNIAQSLNLQNTRTVDVVISHLVKGKLLIRIGTGTYMVNPHIWGIGRWPDIYKLQEKTVEYVQDFNLTTYGKVITT